MLVLNLPFKALMFLTLMRPSLVLFLVLWLKLVKDFLKVRCCLALLQFLILCFFFNDTATTEIYTLSLHDALPICRMRLPHWARLAASRAICTAESSRSEEHTSELQSQSNLVCRLLLEKKKKK